MNLRRRPILVWGLAISGGVALGLASAVAALMIAPRMGMVERGGWIGHPAAGSAQASPYARALIARIGLLAMSREEAVYLDRTRDDAGQRLRGDCRYALQGRVPPAHWWSITLYAEDNYLARNGQNAPSIDATSVSVNSDGLWRAEVGASRPADGRPWIASEGGDHFTLTLRLYRPTTDVFAADAGSVGPTVTKLECPSSAKDSAP